MLLRLTAHLTAEWKKSETYVILSGTTPTRGKYKIYIIDEVHMLTKEAFNALLKHLKNRQHMSYLYLQRQKCIKYR